MLQNVQMIAHLLSTVVPSQTEDTKLPPTSLIVLLSEACHMDLHLTAQTRFPVLSEGATMVI